MVASVANKELLPGKFCNRLLTEVPISHSSTEFKKMSQNILFRKHQIQKKFVKKLRKKSSQKYFCEKKNFRQKKFDNKKFDEKKNCRQKLS